MVSITDLNNPTKILPGYRNIQPVVFSGIFLVDGSKYVELKDALEKLKLNDASLVFSPESSTALGFGFRCGFLGLLHMEIITERLEREFNLDIITTAPGVSYNIYTTKGQMLQVSNPSLMPKPTEIERIEEPIVKVHILTPPEYVGQLWNYVKIREEYILICNILINPVLEWTINYH